MVSRKLKGSSRPAGSVSSSGATLPKASNGPSPQPTSLDSPKFTGILDAQEVERSVLHGTSGLVEGKFYEGSLGDIVKVSNGQVQLVVLASNRVKDVDYT